jgi:hypothetical protein
MSLDMPNVLCSSLSIWDLEGVPQGIANLMFGGNLFPAQVILTLFVGMLFVLPAMLARAKPDVTILMAFFAILASTAVGWLDPAFMMLILAFMGLAYAGVVRKMVGG